MSDKGKGWTKVRFSLGGQEVEAGLPILGVGGPVVDENGTIVGQITKLEDGEITIITNLPIRGLEPYSIVE
jgi:hypothetical protein